MGKNSLRSSALIYTWALARGQPMRMVSGKSLSVHGMAYLLLLIPVYAPAERKKADKVIEMGLDKPAGGLLFAGECAEFRLNVNSSSPKRLRISYEHAKGSAVDGYYISDFQMSECPSSIVDTGVV